MQLEGIYYKLLNFLSSVRGDEEEEEMELSGT